MGRKAKPILSDSYDFDLTPLYGTEEIEKFNKKEESKHYFTEKELDLLKFVVGYFHSYYYGRDKLGTFLSLKEVIDNLIKKNNETIVKEIKNIGITDDEYKSFWSKLV